MIIYNVDGGDTGSDFFPSYAKAWGEVKGRIKAGEDKSDLVIIKMDIGKVNKAKVCMLATGRGFVESQEQVWPKVEGTE